MAYLAVQPIIGENGGLQTFTRSSWGQIMFGIFKKRKPTSTNEPDKLKAAILAANQVACDFSDLVASDSIMPGMVYDVSLLPHPKHTIEKACKIWIQACADKSQLQAWKVVLPTLAQFQEDIGDTPLGIDTTKITSGTPEQMAQQVVDTKQPSPELQAKVNQEEQGLMEWVCDVVD